MRKLLLGLFAVLALNVQGQSFGEPNVFNNECTFIYNFVDEHYFYFISENENKTDLTIDIYNDGIRNIKKIVIPNVAHDEKKPIQVGTTVQALFRYDMKNAHYDGGERSFVTQTLFNNDNKWEYIRGTFLYTTKENESKVYKCTKVEVVSEDGNTLAEIPIDVISEKESYYLEPYLDVVKMGENYYFYKESGTGSSYDLVTTTFYKIQKDNGSGIKINKTAEFKGYPNPVRSNETFTIEVGEENVVSGSFIELSDQSGRMVYRQPITSSEVKVPTNRLKGMYIYTILSDGKAISTGKVIVQ